MQSYLWQMGLDTGEVKGRAEGLAEGLAKGKAEGKAEGEVNAVRQICLDLAQSLHYSVAKRVLPVIQACQQLATLRAWILECPKLSDAAFAALVTSKPTSPRRARTSRPSRGSRQSVAARKQR